MDLHSGLHDYKDNDNNKHLQAFQLIVLARYLLGVPTGLHTYIEMATSAVV